jgi:hypothetical protein
MNSLQYLKLFVACNCFAFILLIVLVIDIGIIRYQNGGLSLWVNLVWILIMLTFTSLIVSLTYLGNHYNVDNAVREAASGHANRPDIRVYGDDELNSDRQHSLTWSESDDIDVGVCKLLGEIVAPIMLSLKRLISWIIRKVRNRMSIDEDNNNTVNYYRYVDSKPPHMDNNPYGIRFNHHDYSRVSPSLDQKINRHAIPDGVVTLPSYSSPPASSKPPPADNPTSMLMGDDGSGEYPYSTYMPPQIAPKVTITHLPFDV